LQRGRIGEHAELAGSIVEAGEFQPGIEPGAVRRLLGQRIRIADFEIGADRRTLCLVLHDHETPRLA